MQVSYYFNEWLQTKYGSSYEVNDGEYGSFAYVNGVRVWSKQHGGSINLADNARARELHANWIMETGA
ncbi:hypothetical protein ACRXCV_00130 (plasmid) [Halobacteriovorax sp. GFR7]|uniref:hypothetical protein n=1 Tax=unclassified Halobacteriovorax TaxID=2639665 RepID=UPI003D958578